MKKQINSKKTTPKITLTKPDMSTRDMAVAYMRSMSDVKWRPGNEIHTENSVVNLYYSPKKEYTGIPYINSDRENSDSNLEKFRHFLVRKENEDLPILPYAVDFYTTHGNDCSSAVYLSWRNFDETMTAVNTHYAFPVETIAERHHLYPIGDLDFGKLENNSKDIIERSGEQRVFEAYAASKKGDCVITHGKSGHERMLSVDPVVVKDENGKIDGEASYVMTIEQTNKFDATRTDGVISTWWVDHKYTFNQLMEKGYLPFTCTGLSREPREFDVMFCNPNVDMTEKYISGKIDCTYGMNELSFTIEKEDGQKVLSRSLFTSRHYVDVDEYKIEIPRLDDGKYVYSVELSTFCGRCIIYRLEFEIGEEE